MKFNIPYSSSFSSSQDFHRAGAEDVVWLFFAVISTIVFRFTEGEYFSECTKNLQ